MWQAITAVAALITAVGGVAVGGAGLIRAGREQGARERADAAGVGLEYLERALAAQQETIVGLKGELGEVKGKLAHCETERVDLARQLGELRDRLP